MTKRWDIVLHSDYPPESCLAKLAQEIDVDAWTVFSFSGYKGKRPILGRIAGNEFRLHKRRYWHNSFGPVLYGRVVPSDGGTSIEAYWDMWPAVRLFMRIWFVLVALMGLPILVLSIREAISKGFVRGDDLWVGLIVPPALMLWGVLLPRLGAALGFHERKHIVQLLERTLLAGQESRASFERTWKSTMSSLMWTP